MHLADTFIHVSKYIFYQYLIKWILAFALFD